MRIIAGFSDRIRSSITNTFMNAFTESRLVYILLPLYFALLTTQQWQLALT